LLGKPHSGKEVQQNVLGGSVVGIDLQTFIGHTAARSHTECGFERADGSAAFGGSVGFALKEQAHHELCGFRFQSGGSYRVVFGIRPDEMDLVHGLNSAAEADLQRALGAETQGLASIDADAHIGNQIDIRVERSFVVEQTRPYVLVGADFELPVAAQK
jgi:hypothetical protein